MQTKNINAASTTLTTEMAEASECTYTSTSMCENICKIAHGPPPPLPPRLSRPRDRDSAQNYTDHGCSTAPMPNQICDVDPSAYAPYKKVPLPKPYPPPYRMPPVPPPTSSYPKYGSEPILPGTLGYENPTQQLYSIRYPPPVQREIDLSMKDANGHLAEAPPSQPIPKLADLHRAQRARISAAVAPEPGPPTPISDVWKEERPNARSIPFQQRMRTLLNHSPVNPNASNNKQAPNKVLEGEPLLPPSTRRAVSYPDGISNPALEENDSYVPSHAQQRRDGARGQLILETAPNKFPAYESNPNLSTSSGLAMREGGMLNGWSSQNLSENGHTDHLRTTCLKLYPLNSSTSMSQESRQEYAERMQIANSSGEHHSAEKVNGTSMLKPANEQNYYHLRDVYTPKTAEEELSVHQPSDNGEASDHHVNAAVYNDGPLSQNGQTVNYSMPTNDSVPQERPKDSTIADGQTSQGARSSVTGDLERFPPGLKQPANFVPGAHIRSPSYLQKGSGSGPLAGETDKRIIDGCNLMNKYSHESHPSLINNNEWKVQKNLFTSHEQRDIIHDRGKWTMKENALTDVAGSNNAPVAQNLPEPNGQKSAQFSDGGHASAGSSDYEKNTHSSSHSQDATTSESGRGTLAETAPSSNKSSSLSGMLDSSIDSDTNMPSRPTRRGSDWTEVTEKELHNLINLPDSHISPRNLDSTISDSLSVTPPLPSLTPTHSRCDSPIIHPSNNNTPSKYKLSYSAPLLNSRSHHITPEHLEAAASSWQSGDKKTGRRQHSSMNADLSQGWNGSYLPSSMKMQGVKPQQRLSKSRVPLGLTNIHEGGDGEITSTTTGLDMESLLDDSSEVASDRGSSPGSDVHELRRQLEGLESMYSEVLRLLGIKSHGNGMGQRSLAELKPRRKVHGSLSSLTGKGYASSTRSRGFKDRHGVQDKRKLRDGLKGAGKRFQRLESHVVTLARSVAHLSSEMRTQHIMFQEIETLRREVGQIRECQMALRMQQSASIACNRTAGRSGLNEWENFRSSIPSLTNPTRIKKLAKFFGDEPPLLRLFLKKLGYEKYASNFEAERIGMIELPYLTEERLQKIGIPMGPRMRILQEAQMSFRQEHFNIYIV